MKIELKSLRTNERLSEETQCFSATLYVDGVKRGEVLNHGQGGPNEYTDRTVEAELDAYGKTLPTQHYHGMDLEQNADLLIGEAMDRAKLEKDLRGKVLMRNEKGQLVETKRLKAADLPKAIAHFAKLPGCTVLNSLPIEQAWALYKQD
jgi:hypothetical protein